MLKKFRISFSDSASIDAAVFRERINAKNRRNDTCLIRAKRAKKQSPSATPWEGRIGHSIVRRQQESPLNESQPLRILSFLPLMTSKKVS